MYQYQTMEVLDFSGGKTDNYIEGPSNQGKEFDNLLIQKNRKPKSRPGITFYVSAAQAQIPPGNVRISGLIKHAVNRNLFATSGRNVYYVSSGSWTTLQGPVSSNPALGAGSASSFHSWSDWKNHTILCNDALSDPCKIYRDQSGNYQVRTAGMPSPELEGAIDLANDIKTKYNLHRQDTGQHAFADTVNAVSAANATDLDSLLTLVAELIVDYTAHNADANLAAAWAYHIAQAPVNRALASTTAPTSLSEAITALDDLKTKYNAHDNDNTTHTVGGSHQVTVVRLPSITGAGAETYLYRFLYYYQYYVDDVLHEDFGPTLEVEGTSLTTGTKSIASIPAISNGGTRCYDTANIKVKIYRTVSAGTDFYYVGEVANGTTTFSDTVSDVNLVLNEPIYTTGGVLENDPPPKAKYFVACNDIGVYAYIKTGTLTYPTGFITSIPGDVDSVPGSFQDEVETDITGVSSIGIYPLLFCRNRIYRLEGIIDALGRGTVFKREVSRTKGSISNSGIVRIPQGVVFPGEDGFYFTDGFSDPQILSIHLIDTYKNFVSSATNEKRIYGEYDSAQNRVHWTVNEDSSNSDNDSIFVLDLNFGLKADSVYTTMSGQGDSFRPSALAFYNGEMVQADSRGYVFKYDDDVATDLKVNTAVAATSWTTYAIIYDYQSCAYNFGTDDRFKWIPLMSAEFKNEVNVSIAINSNNEDSGLFRNLKEVRSRELITWGDPNIIWGDESQNYYWDVANVITAKRRFPSGSMRCLLKQIQITNSFTNIYNSDTYGVASVDVSAKTVTIPSDVGFPTDIVDYFITFEEDDYTEEYLITARTSATVLAYSDPEGTSVTGTNVKWLIRGYAKGELINIISYSLPFAVIGRIHTPWRGEDGSNA